MNINFITSNKLKFDIASTYFASLDGLFMLKQHALDVPELQAESVTEVAAFSAREAVKVIGEPCIVSDAGLMIEALNGFPGPFVKYANQWLGVEGYLHLLSHTDNRRAYWEDALALAFSDGTTRVFTRREYGRFAESAIASKVGWAANDLFIPDGYDVPLGQLSREEQIAFWGAGCWPNIVDYLQQWNDDIIPYIGKPAASALIGIGITKSSQLKEFTEKDLLAIHGIGPKAIRMLRDAGLKLKGEK